MGYNSAVFYSSGLNCIRTNRLLYHIKKELGKVKK